MEISTQVFMINKLNDLLLGKSLFFLIDIKIQNIFY